MKKKNSKLDWIFKQQEKPEKTTTMARVTQIYMKLVRWPLMGVLLHLVQQGGALAGRSPDGWMDGWMEYKTRKQQRTYTSNC